MKPLEHSALNNKRFEIPFIILPFISRVKSGIFGQTAKFGQRHSLFHISNIGIKNIN